MKKLTGLVLLVWVLAGCTTTERFASTGSNSAPGGAAPATTASTAGTPSALTGSAIDRDLDADDRRAIADSQRQALAAAGPNRPVAWRNPATGHYGQAAAGPAYVVNDRSCRDFRHEIYADDKSETLRGTACQEGGGEWKEQL